MKNELLLWSRLWVCGFCAIRGTGPLLDIMNGHLQGYLRFHVCVHIALTSSMAVPHGVGEACEIAGTRCDAALSLAKAPAAHGFPINVRNLGSRPLFSNGSMWREMHLKIGESIFFGESDSLLPSDSLLNHRFS